MRGVYTRLSKKPKRIPADLVILNTPQNDPKFTVCEVEKWEDDELLVHWWTQANWTGNGSQKE